MLAVIIAKIAEILNNSTGAMLNINELQKQAQTTEVDRMAVSEEIVTELPITAETTSAPVMTVAATSSMTTAAQETDLSETITSSFLETSIISETTVLSEAVITAPPEQDNTVKADSIFRVKDICKVAWKGNSAGDLPQFFDYDAKNGLLYIQSDVFTLDSYNVRTEEKKNIVDFSQATDKMFGGIVVNPFSGKLYAAIQEGKTAAESVLYNITDDQQIMKITQGWQFPSSGGHTYTLRDMIYFKDEDTVCLADVQNNAWPCYDEYSLKNGSKGNKVKWYPKPKDVDITPEYVKPFLWKDSYYYVCAEKPYAGNGSMFVAKTVRLNAEKCKQKVTVFSGNTADAPGICVMQDAFCYIDKQKNIFRFDPDSERNSGSLLSEMSNPDILLVSGSKIEETATGYLSNSIPIFLRIDNSRFVMFDASDSTLKLLYTE